MSVKYAFNKGNERLFGTAYEFGNEAEKDAVLALLQEALGENLTAVRSFASGRAFDQQEAADWLRTHGATEEQVAAFRPVGENAQEEALSPEEQARRGAIRRIVQERGIKHLMHFTRIENLPGIRDRGLQSRAALGDDGCVWNDDWRRDKRRHAICLSVSYPNYKMFFDYRERKGGDWAVLLLDPCLLWELDCGFVEVNAAGGAVPQRPEDELKSLAALERMFENVELRAALQLPPHYTTNPQAEVLVFEPIVQTFIQEIHIKRELEEPVYYDCNGHVIPIKTDGTYFWPRQDYRHWQKWAVYG